MLAQLFLQHPVLFSNLRKLGCGSVAASTQLQSRAWFQIKGNLVSFPRHRDKNRAHRNLRGSPGVLGYTWKSQRDLCSGRCQVPCSSWKFQDQHFPWNLCSGRCRGDALRVMSSHERVLFLLLLTVPEVLGAFQASLGFMRFRYTTRMVKGTVLRERTWMAPLMVGQNGPWCDLLCLTHPWVYLRAPILCGLILLNSSCFNVPSRPALNQC